MYRRFATSVIFTGFFLFGMVFILWGVMLPDIAQSLAMSELVSGVFFSLISVGAILGAFVAGKYIQKFDFMSLFAFLSCLVALLLCLMSLVTHWLWMLLGAFLLGLFCSSLFTIGHTMIARLYVERRSKMMGLMDFMFSLGTLVVPFYVSALYWIEHDWRWPIRWLAIGVVLLGTYAWYVAAKARSMVPVENEPPRKSLSYSHIIKQPVFFFLALAAMGYGAVEFGNVNWFVSYAQEGRGLSGEDARLVFAFFTGGMAISRLGFYSLLRWFTPHRLMLILASTMLVGAFIIKLAMTPTILSVGNFLVGLGLGGLFPLMLSHAMDIDSHNGPLISGVCVIGSSVGVQLASLGTGVWANFAPLVTAFWVVPIAALWLWSMVWFFSRRIKSAISL